jgi:hypothetical protein
LLGVLALLSAAAAAGDVLDALAQLSPKEAARTLQWALDRSPAPQELLAATAPRYWPAIKQIADTSPAGKDAVRTLLRRLQAKYPACKVNEKDLARLVSASVEHPSFVVRFDASMDLAKRYGALAVPALVERLSSENAEVKVNAHITLMNRLGTTAVMPLLAALHSQNPVVRAMVAGELGVIGDARALAALCEVADTDRDEGVRKSAARARDHLKAKFVWAKRRTTADLYAHLAWQYYEGQSGTAPCGRPMLWRWRGGIVAQPVAPHLYLTVVAERMAAAALRHDQDHERAKDVLTRIHKARRIADALVTELR